MEMDIKRRLPWAQIGTQFETPPSTTEEALRKAELDWEVELRPLTYPDDAGRSVEVPGRHATVRKDTGEVLGVVGSRYTLVQNADAFSFVDRLTGQGDIMAAWHHKGSAQVGVAVRLGEVVHPFGNGDGGAGGIQPYLVFQNSHDGSRSLQCHVVNFQLVCTNQMASVARKSLAGWSAPHTASIEHQMSIAGNALELLAANKTAYVEELRALADVAVTEQVFDSIVKTTLADLGYKDRGLRNAYNGIRETWVGSDTIDPHLRQTGCGLMHAVTEYWDHERQYRTPSANFNSVMRGTGRACRDRVHKRLLDKAGSAS